jgi:hypothetical protein
MSSLTTNARRTLPCPNCGEMIYSDSTQCRFCSTPLDAQAAEAGAKAQQQINDACNYAKWIRNFAGAIWVFFLIGLIITAGQLAFLAGIFLVPISLILWQIRYGRLKTDDPDYKKAKRDCMAALFLWLPAMLLQLVLWIAL